MIFVSIVYILFGINILNLKYFLTGVFISSFQILKCEYVYMKEIIYSDICFKLKNGIIHQLQMYITSFICKGLSKFSTESKRLKYV